MLSFWPSFSLLAFFLVIFLECRVIGGRVTLPLGSFLMVFCYGCIGAPLLALLLQQIPIFPDAGVDPAAPIAWLLGPPIEELAKALPVIVLAFLTRESRRLSIADLTLVGFASGAGFGFVEGNLHALVNGTLPSLQHLAAFGLQTETGVVFFAGHPVSTALVGLAAGIGLRFLPLNIVYAWVPSAFVILWATFDHGIYNWKMLNAGSTGGLPDAHFAVEFLHGLTLRGQLATWLLPVGLIAAQLFEAYLCSKAVGARRDLLLAREWRPWVINEWLVVLLRAPRGRAAFGQTLAYFRLRRAFFLAMLEAKRDPTDPTLSRHARSLEDRLKRERSILFDPPLGTWLLPLPILKTYAAQWTWRMRWVLVFAVLLLFLFMLDPGSLPEWLRQFLFGEIFTMIVVTAGLAFAVWRIVLFARLPPLDPLATEGAAYAGYYTRALLLGCSFVCGLFPVLALLLGWKAFAPAAAFISGYLPGWIGQGGNLQTLLGLGAMGSAVAPDPRPAGEALRHEIAGGDARIRRLGRDIEHKVGADESASPGAAPLVRLNAFLEAMAKLDAERDAQARRRLALDECARQANEATLRDPAPAVQAVKDEFDRLASELIEAAAKELDAIATIEQAYGRAWSEIMQDLDAHDALRRRLRTPLRQAWQVQNDIAWALRVVEGSDECLLPMQLTLLPELHALASTAQSARADMVAAGIERIRTAAGEYGEANPFAVAAGTDQADEDEAALLAEFAFSAPSAEAPKAFGLRAPTSTEALARPVVDGKVARVSEPSQAATPTPVQSRGQHYQDALDQLIDTTGRDQAYLDTIRHLELSDETLRQPIEPAAAEAPPPDTIAQDAAPKADAVEAHLPSSHPAETLPAVAPESEREGALKELIDAIKRDSGYLDFVKDPQAAQDQDNRDQPKPPNSALQADDALEAHDAPAPAGEQAADDAGEVPEGEAPTADRGDPTGHEPLVVPTSREPDGQPSPERAEFEDDAAVHRLETVVAATADAEAEEQAAADAAPQVVDEPVSVPETEEPQPDDVSATPGEVDEPASPEDDFSPLSASSDDAETAKTEPETSARSDEPLVESLRGGDADTETPDQAHAEEIGARAETFDPVKAEEPTAEKPRGPSTNAETRHESEGPPARTEIRSSLFARLFQAIGRQSSDSAVKPARGDRWLQESETAPVEIERAQTPTTPSIDEGADAALPDKRESEPENSPDEIAAPTAAWLVNLAATNSNDVTAQSGDLSLEAIEWPALSSTAEDHVRVQALHIATSNVDVAELIGVPDGEADAQQPLESTPTPDQAIDIAPLDVALAADTVQPAGRETPDHDAADAQLIESAPAVDDTTDVAPAAALSHDLPKALIDDEPAQPADASVDVADETGADALKADGADTFSSKADRLSDLLAKLEGAMQAKATAEATPRQADAGLLPVEADRSATPAQAADDGDPQLLASDPTTLAEPETSAPDGPSEQTPQIDEHDDSPVLLGVAPAAAVEAPAAAVETLVAALEPVDVRSGASGLAQDQGVPDVEAEQPETAIEPAAQLQPDRLSYLLTKLFEAVKRQSIEQDLKPHGTSDEEAPTPSQSAMDEETADDILDLRLPDSSPAEADDGEAIEFGTPSGDAADSGPSNEREPDIEGRRLAPAALAESTEAASAPPELPVTDISGDAVPLSAPLPEVASDDAATPEIRDAEPMPRAPLPLATSTVSPAAVPTQPRERPAELRTPSAEPAARFGSRSRPPRLAAAVRDAEAKPSAPERSPEPAEAETPATTPRRDWKLGSGNAARGENSKATESQAEDTGAAKKSETTFRVKTGSGALATVDAPPPGSSASAEKMPGKYYGPRLAKGADDETAANTPAQERALSLADALTEYYAKAGQPQPPMHTTDRSALQRIIASGKLEAPRRRGAPWSVSGMSRRGDVAVRLKPGAEQFVEFVPSTEIFGQVPHYYPRGVGKGSYATHIPAGHLEYFDLTTRQWAPLQRG